MKEFKVGQCQHCGASWEDINSKVEECSLLKSQLAQAQEEIEKLKTVILEDERISDDLRKQNQASIQLAMDNLKLSFRNEKLERVLNDINILIAHNGHRPTIFAVQDMVVAALRETEGR